MPRTGSSHEFRLDYKQSTNELWCRLGTALIVGLVVCAAWQHSDDPAHFVCTAQMGDGCFLDALEHERGRQGLSFRGCPVGSEVSYHDPP
jgi:hypothetical protein